MGRELTLEAQGEPRGRAGICCWIRMLRTRPCKEQRRVILGEASQVQGREKEMHVLCSRDRENTVATVKRREQSGRCQRGGESKAVPCSTVVGGPGVGLAIYSSDVLTH